MNGSNRVRRPLLAAVAASVLAAAFPAFAQQVPAPSVPAIVAPALSAAAAAAGAPAQPEPPKWPDFNTVVKDMAPMPGLFTLYRYKAEDNSKDQTKVLAQIPKSLMKQDLLLATSISRGPMAGYQWDDYLVRFEIQGKLVVISVPDARFVTNAAQPVSDAVSRTYNDGFLAAMPIITFSPSGDPVVDIGGPLLTPLVNLPPSAMGAQPRRDLSTFPKVKSFPDNVLVDADIAIAGRTGAGTSVGLSYSFRRLPALGSYAPRIADERVGYFTTVRQDWFTKYTERENVVRYVNRWDVKKKDPTLELSPPEKPIVFVIEKTVPLQWRKYVAEGILEFNKAYEKLGIVGAIVVQQQTDDNEFANVDPEDARYNFLRWIVTGRGFAMGPSRADPRTGQILDADIIFDDSMLRFYFREFDVFGPGAVAGMMGPEFTQFLLQNPQFIPHGMTLDQVKESARGHGTDNHTGELLHDAASTAAAGQRPADVLVSKRLSPARTACNYATGMQQQVAMAQLAVAATGKKIPDRFIGEVIREIVAHEVGHTIGLRHNFKASAWLSEAEIKKRRDTTDEPLVASVMDYNPVVYFAGDDINKLRHFITPCIGPYDYWAIEYGYKINDGKSGDEKAFLQQIAGQGTKRELAYATDEDTVGLTSVDPAVNRFDLSDDPIAWSKSRAALCDQLLKTVKTWGLRPDQPKHYLRETFMTIMSAKARDMMYVSRLVGGQHFNRNRSGDPDAKPAMQLLDPKRQREALNTLEATIFKDDFFATESELFNELAPNRWMDWYSMPATRVDFPVHQSVQSMQSFALLALVSPQVLQRVYDAELKSKADDKFTAAELITRVKTIIWGNLSAATSGDTKFTDAKPMLSSLKRNLQRQYVSYMLNIADSKPGQLVSADLQGMASYAMKDLSDDLAKALEAKDKLDFATRAHLSQTKAQIDRVLNAPHINFPAGGLGGGIIILGQPTGQQQQQ
jgi:hypothetical protein